MATFLWTGWPLSVGLGGQFRWNRQFLHRVEEKLESDHGKSIRDCVDFYAGTSTGSIIALALATTRLSMSAISDLYDFNTAAKIFKENEGWFEIDGINAPKFEAEGKKSTLEENLGDATLNSAVLDNKHVLAVTYAIEKRKPVVIKSTDPTNLGLKSCDVADASSAAPTYFPTREIEIPAGGDDYWLVDGGVIANNPTMCAIVEAKKVWSVPLSEIRVLSIGTGFLTKKINGPQSKKWGGIQWMSKGHIMDLLSDERIVAYQAKEIIDQGKYIRVNASLKPQPGLPNAPDDAMDDVSRTNIKRLKELGDFWFQQYGNPAVGLLLDTYSGPSLDRIDHETGKPT
ncbi:MAG: patatin-like phospholipase family protein [Magnetococcales bacterium]|nr:patatin-like phospholipase family protein [Magnetococcales bacterium]